jgi:hypothetical protein
MHRKSERGLEHVLLPHAHAEGEQQPRHVTRKISRQLDASAFDEEIDDGEIEAMAAGGGEGLGARAHHLHAMTLAPQYHGHGPATGDIAVDEKHAIDG